MNHGKTMPTADAYFFDIDGTLVVTRDLVHWNALHQAMREVYGIDTTIEGIAYHGKTDVGILRAALSRCGVDDSRFEAGLSSALSVVCREVAANVSGMVPEVCPAIPELLSEITEREKLLGVASGNLESVGWAKLSAAGLRPFFSTGSFGDLCEMRTAIFDLAASGARKLLGAKTKICFVGDTPEDIKAAKNVGGQVVAVCTGIFNLDDLKKFDPDVCCQTCAELIGSLQ